jgi:uncharacterized protein (TIGR02453 family)
MINENILQFLKELSGNNNREWYHANKHKYTIAKKDFENFVNIAIHEISRFDDQINALSAGDCIFRIFRDTRFSPDKTPYKTNMGAFIAKGGRKSGYAGYYIHVDPAGSFLAGGVYMPPSPQLKLIRQEIFNFTDEFKQIIQNKKFIQHFGKLIDENKLKGVPRGYSKDFPDIDLLKYTSYTVFKNQTEAMIRSNDFIGEVKEVFEAMRPLNHFLNRAIDDGQGL